MKPPTIHTLDGEVPHTATSGSVVPLVKFVQLVPLKCRGDPPAVLIGFSRFICYPYVEICDSIRAAFVELTCEVPPRAKQANFDESQPDQSVARSPRRKIRSIRAVKLA